MRQTFIDVSRGIRLISGNRGLTGRGANVARHRSISRPQPHYPVNALAYNTVKMKRKVSSGAAAPEVSRKKPRANGAAYCDTPPSKDENGDDVWPAPEEEMGLARRIIKQW